MLHHEIRSSLRSMLRRPLYPIVAVIVLALGLAASIATFTYINGFFQPFALASSGSMWRMTSGLYIAAGLRQ